MPAYPILRPMPRPLELFGFCAWFVAAAVVGIAVPGSWPAGALAGLPCGFGALALASRIAARQGRWGAASYGPWLEQRRDGRSAAREVAQSQVEGIERPVGLATCFLAISLLGVARLSDGPQSDFVHTVSGMAAATLAVPGVHLLSMRMDARARTQRFLLLLFGVLVCAAWRHREDIAGMLAR